MSQSNQKTSQKPKFKHNNHHSFGVELAIKYTDRCAIMLQNFEYWTRLNQANDNNFIDGRYWTYNKLTAFQELFPYWSINTIRTTIGKLVSEGLIIKGNYNKKAYDKTVWYALTDFGLMECGLIDKKITYPQPSVEINNSIDSGFAANENPTDRINTDMLKSTHGDVEINTPIPDTNAVTKRTLRKDVFSETEKVKELVRCKLKDNSFTINQAVKLIDLHYKDKSKPVIEHIEWSLNNFIKHYTSEAGASIKRPVAVFMDRIQKTHYWEENTVYTKEKEPVNDGRDTPIHPSHKIYRSEAPRNDKNVNSKNMSGNVKSAVGELVGAFNPHFN